MTSELEKPFMDKTRFVYVGKWTYHEGFSLEQNKRINDCPPCADFREQMIKCGKKNCACYLPTGAKHGPYWYASWYEKSKLIRRYIGRKQPTRGKQLDNEIRVLAEEEAINNAT
jgi:hypothetical protein